ncbi:hypothetical protein ACFL27_05705 [candidate division CSSED10-310 bacterium]|uniref:Uncharacterized protein n=1 Tax=candidate division CSSED10-310 bacterium TaxID=2855610 RepID=A0ABV6YUD2_UNCC1
MNIFKKDQARAEMILIIGFIVLAFVVVARFFGPEIATFFFGAGSNLKDAGKITPGEIAPSKSTGNNSQDEKKKKERSSGIDQSDPALYGDEEAVANLHYKEELEQRNKIKKMVLWTFALVGFIVTLGLIVWKTYTIVMEIRRKNVEM